MFSFTIFKKAIKANYFLWSIVTLTTTLFLSTTLFAVNNLSSSGATLPGANGNIFVLLDQTFFSMIGILLPLIYVVVVSNKLVAKEVDNGSLAFTLTTPVGRTRLIVSRALFLFLFITLMFVILTAVGVTTANVLGIDYELSTMLQLMSGLYFLELAFAGVAFLTSCIFNKTSLSLGLGVGITLGMFLLSTIGNLASELEGLKYLSFIQFYNVPSIIANNTNHLSNCMVLFILFAGLSSVGIQIFLKKNLPL